MLTVNTPVAAIRYGKSAQKFHVVEIVFVKLFRLPCDFAQFAEVQKAVCELPVWVQQWHGRPLPTGSEVRYSQSVWQSVCRHVNRAAQQFYLSEILIISASNNLPLCDILEHNALTAGVSNKLVGQTTRAAMQPCWLLNVYFVFAVFETCRRVTALCVHFIACSALSEISLNYMQILSPYRAVNTLRLCYKNQSVNVV